MACAHTPPCVAYWVAPEDGHTVQDTFSVGPFTQYLRLKRILRSFFYFYHGVETATASVTRGITSITHFISVVFVGSGKSLRRNENKWKALRLPL